MNDSLHKPGKPQRPLRFRLLLAGAVFAAALLSLEVGGRVYARATYKERGYRFDEALGFRPLPNIQKKGWYWHGTEPAQINSKGIRDAEHPYEKPAGVTRIVAIGDSFTYGAEVDYGERFTEYLEEELDSVEVINLGVNSYGTDQELKMLEVEALRYEPDLALLTVFFGNDFEDITFARTAGWNRPWFDLVDGELIPHTPEETWGMRLRSSSYVAEMAMRMLTNPAKDFAVAENWKDRDVVPLFVALVERMNTVAADAGLPLLVVLAYPPERMSEEPTDREARARAGLESAGIQLVDTYPLFAGRSADRGALYRPGHHWTATGHALVGEAIRQKILSERLLAE